MARSCRGKNVCAFSRDKDGLFGKDFDLHLCTFWRLSGDFSKNNLGNSFERWWEPECGMKMSSDSGAASDPQIDYAARPLSKPNMEMISLSLKVTFRFDRIKFRSNYIFRHGRRGEKTHDFHALFGFFPFQFDFSEAKILGFFEDF